MSLYVGVGVIWPEAMIGRLVPALMVAFTVKSVPLFHGETPSNPMWLQLMLGCTCDPRDAVAQLIGEGLAYGMKWCVRT